jgi:hypothetical protein
MYYIYLHWKQEALRSAAIETFVVINACVKLSYLATEIDLFLCFRSMLGHYYVQPTVGHKVCGGAAHAAVGA